MQTCIHVNVNVRFHLIKTCPFFENIILKVSYHYNTFQFKRFILYEPYKWNDTPTRGTYYLNIYKCIHAKQRGRWKVRQIYNYEAEWAYTVHVHII